MSISQKKTSRRAVLFALMLTPIAEENNGNAGSLISK
jgi:hypothetical protein